MYTRGDRFATGSPFDLVLVIALGGVGLLGVSVLALGAGMVANVFDLHAHRCDACGNTWRHTGRASHGSEAAHTCARCGSLQWWRPGEREEKEALMSRQFALDIYQGSWSGQ